jgi:hypothetical protein
VENEIKLKLSVGQEDKRNVEVKEDPTRKALQKLLF